MSGDIEGRERGTTLSGLIIHFLVLDLKTTILFFASSSISNTIYVDTPVVLWCTHACTCIGMVCTY